MTQAAPASPPAMTLASLGLTARIVSDQRLGGGSVAWLVVEPAATHIGLADGLAGFEIAETGHVPHLRARNRAGSPVLIPSDTVVGGGWQTRVVERSVVVASGAEAAVPVRCVEQHRWGGTREFAVQGTTSAPTRAHFARMKDRALDAGVYELEQREVWRTVAEELTRSGVTSATHSYADLLRSRRPRRRTQRMPAPPAEANGALVVHGAETAWIEAFASAAHLCARAPALLEDVASSRDRGSEPRDVQSMLAETWEAALAPIETVHGTLGDAMAVRGRRAVGSVLLVDGALAHLAASVGAA